MDEKDSVDVLFSGKSWVNGQIYVILQPKTKQMRRLLAWICWESAKTTTL
ncbi:MAG: hypothetical protein HUK11_09815 [Muribaculaceae bacterium]|nr:hypothetical protein [Muribaculaceae bacterium]